MITFFVVAGAILPLIGISFYMKEMLTGKVKPNKMTWLVWSVAPLIATFAALSSGVTLAVVPVFMAGFGPLIVLILSFFRKEAYWKIKKLDYGCGALSALALMLWYMTKDPVIAIVFSIACDMLAFIPTLIKSWKYPETEDSIVYATYLLSACTSFPIAKRWDFPTLAYPVYLIISSLLLVLLIERRRLFK